MDNSNKIFLDADFCNLFSGIKNSSVSANDLFNKFIDPLKKQPCIHNFIVQNELLTNEFILEKITNNNIEVIDPKNEIESIDLYVILFQEFYKFLMDDKKKNCSNLNIDEYNRIMSLPDEFNGDPFNSRIASSNMGEAHTLVTAFLLEIPVFLSNDTGAKELARQRINTAAKTKIEIFSGLDLLLKSKESCMFARNELRVIFAKYPTWKNFYLQTE